MTTRAIIDYAFRALPGVAEVSLSASPGMVAVLVERCGPEIGVPEIREVARSTIAAGVVWTIRVRRWRWRLSRWAWRRWHLRICEPRILVVNDLTPIDRDEARR